MSATVSAGFDGAADGKDGSASISGSSNGWNWRLGVAGKDYGLLDTPIGKAEHTEFKSKSADAFLSYDIDPDKTIGLTLSHYDLDFWTGDQSVPADDFWVHVPEWKRTRGAIFGEFKNISDTLSRVRIDLSQERTGDQSVPADDFWVHVPEWKRTRGAIFGEFKNISDTLSRVRIDLSQERNAKKMDNHVKPDIDASTVMKQFMPKLPFLNVPSGTLSRVRIDLSQERNAKKMDNHVKPDIDASTVMKQFMPKLPFLNVPSGNLHDVTVDNFTDNTTDTTALSIQTDWNISDNHFLIAGYELSYDKLKANSTSHIQANGIGVEITGLGKPMDGKWTGDATVPVANKYEGDQTRHSIFLAMESTFSDDWVANYGVRYTWVKSNMDIHKESTKGAVDLTKLGMPPIDISMPIGGSSESVDSSDGKAVFNAGLSYNGFDNLSLRALTKLGMPPIDISMPIGGSSESVDSSDGKAVFNAGLSYNGFDNLSLRANYSQGYRAPILQELFIDSLMGGRFTYANPNLKPETTDNFELGARYQDSGLMVDAAVFYSEADNYITAVQFGDPNTPMFHYDNIAKAKTLGFEMTSSLRMGDAVFYSEADNYITAVQFGDPNTPMFHYDNIAKAKTLGFEMTSSLRMGDFEPYTSVTLLSREYEQDGDTSKKTGTPKASARIGVRYFTTAMDADWNADLYAVTQTKSEEYDFKNKTTSSYAGFTTFNLTGGVAFGPDKAYRWNADLYAVTQTKSEEYDFKNKTTSSYAGFTTFNLTGGVAFGPDKAYRLDAGIYNIGDKLYRYNGGKMDDFVRTVYEPGRHAAVKFTATF